MIATRKALSIRLSQSQRAFVRTVSTVNKSSGGGGKHTKKKGKIAQNSEAKTFVQTPSSSHYEPVSTPLYGADLAASKSTLPILDVSPILDPARFCRRSSFSTEHNTKVGDISGSAAARRLSLGRDRIRDIIQLDLQNDVSERTAPEEKGEQISGRKRRRRRKTTRKTSATKRAKAFVLSGHGIPTQLLRDHVDLGDVVLRMHGPASECSFSNFNGEVDVHWMRFLDKKGENYASPWPPSYNQYGGADIESLQHRLDLFLTVMNRMAINFAKVIDHPPNYFHNQEESEEELDDETNNSTAPRIWKVQFLRGLVHPHSLLHAPTKLGPIVELTHRKGISAQCNVRITLQSAQNATAEGAVWGSRPPVSLVFDACFSANEVYHSPLGYL